MAPALKQIYAYSRGLMMISHELTLPNLGLHLTNAGLLNKDMAYDAAYHAKNDQIPFISYLVKKNILSSQEILFFCQKIFSLPIFDLEDYEESAATLLTWELIRQYRVIPIWKKNNILHVGISDPTEQYATDAIAFQTRLTVKIFLLDEGQLSHFLETYYGHNASNRDVQKTLLRQIKLEETQNVIQDKAISYDEPLIKFVDNIIQHAFQQHISDIHIECYETICRIRYRLHGILYTVNEIHQQLASRIVLRLKVMARLNIAEKRLPQDGRFQLDNIDIRINICPTLFGEKAVLRLLNSNQISLAINQLGFSKLQEDLFVNAINMPQGMILVTGPTGSGKTVTLYSALNYLNNAEKNISTVEDPIEIRLTGINQVNVNYKIGLDFATALRAFLRQDPDIIMLGEIRDLETAEIAIQASQTGHLVLSTLHTNSAIGTIARLCALGLPSYHLAEALSLIIAQRLIRTLCDVCKIQEKLSRCASFAIKKKNPPEYVYRAVGCNQCNQGYTTRIAIYECLPITEKLRSAILAENDRNSLLSCAIQDGFITLKEIAIDYFLRGITSFNEINRVLKL